MFRKFLSILGITASGLGSAHGAEAYSPYADTSINQIYHLLFCDDLSGWRPQAGQSPTEWQTILFSDTVSIDAARALANDQATESRVRALAYNWLKSHGQAVPERQLLGVVVEVPMPGGLDVVAAYVDGSARYINYTGKIAVIEGGLPETQPIVRDLLAASQGVVNAIGPWDEQRLPPPTSPNARLTFVVSDGLYFGQGPMNDLMQDAIARPVIEHAALLLETITKAVLEGRAQTLP